YYITFFFSDPPPSDIYTLSLHDALPIFLFQNEDPQMSKLICSLSKQSDITVGEKLDLACSGATGSLNVESLQIKDAQLSDETPRSEEHTSELQSRENLVCRLLLEKKKRQ